jgi:hypothetical protein
VNATTLLMQGFEQVEGLVTDLVRDVSTDDLCRRLTDEANSPTWLLWHLARVQDAQVADAFGAEQVWFQGWADRFALPFVAHETGYGMSAGDVGRVRAPGELLGGYLSAVHAQTQHLLSGLGDDDLERVVDDSYDPPVTLGVRLLSVLADDLQHVGQAAILLGL